MLRENLQQIVTNDFVSLAYRKKYNLTFNDERFLGITEQEMFYDMLITNEFEKQMKDLYKQREEDGDDFEEEIDKGFSLEDLQSGRVQNAHVGGFSKEEIEKLWNDDSLIDK